MVKTSLTLLAAICLLGTGPAMARGYRHHHRYHRHFTHHGPYTIGYGETILSGKTGLHRSLFGVMVPDSRPAAGDDFILTGRARGSGLGANGLPGVNYE